MAQRRYRRYRRKSHRFRNFIIFLFFISIVGVTVWLLINNFTKAEDLLGESLYPIKYSEHVDKASQDYNLEKSLIYAVIRTESDFNPKCESHAGAMGLMQVMPESFEWINKLKGETLGTENLLKPEVNIDYGSYLLSYFYKYYGNEQCALAAYNAGFVVSDWLKDSNYSSDGKTLDNVPYPETDKYIKKVERAKKMYNKLYFS